MWRRGQSAPAESEEHSDDEVEELELPAELVGQYVDLGRRRQAVWDALVELLAQHAGLGSVADLDDETIEGLEEELEEMIVESYGD